MPTHGFQSSLIKVANDHSLVIIMPPTVALRELFPDDLEYDF